MGMTVEEWAKDFKAFVDELQMPRDDYKGIIAYIEDGTKLLKEQEPRVMTLDEINGMEWDYCYVEDEVIMDKTQRMMFGEHRIHCITWPSIASYKMFYGEDGYGKRWRCWTSKPTAEQREATLWEPPKGE